MLRYFIITIFALYPLPPSLDMPPMPLFFAATPPLPGHAFAPWRGQLDAAMRYERCHAATIFALMPRYDTPR